MNKLFPFLFTFLLYCSALGCYGQKIDPYLDFPQGFSEAAMKHVSVIHNIGEHPDGSSGGKVITEYISRMMKEAGLEVTMDTFTFLAFQSKKISLDICGKKFIPQQMILNPYQGPVNYKGDFMMFYPDSSVNLQMMQDFSGKIVVTCQSPSLLRLSDRSPKIIVILEKEDFNTLKSLSKNFTKSQINLRFNGKVRKISSANIVGTLKPENTDSSEVIVCTHWDSFESGSVHDNASGIGTLLELAKYFASHRNEFRTTLRFVYFGASETGMNGAFAYIDHHPDQLKNCRLLFNIDAVNGIHNVYVDMTGGVSGISREKGIIKNDVYFKRKAIRDKGSKWLWLGDYPIASDVPLSLRDNILGVCNRLSLKIEQVEGLTSDHQAFSLAGIPSTAISTESNEGELKIYPEGMWLAGRIVAGVVLKYLTPVVIQKAP